jgi:hypothetical protein
MALRPQPVLGIDPKMYRHFAAATVVITLLLAMVAASVDSTPQEKDTEATKAVPSKTASGTGIRQPAGTSAVTPVANTVATPEGDMPGAGVGFNQTPATVQAPTNIVVDQAMLARMAPDQRANYLRMVAARRAGMGLYGAGPGNQPLAANGLVQPSKAQINAVMEAARRRGGGDVVE